MRISEAGNDMYICQVCGRDLDSVKHPPEWRTDITKRESAGNVCPDCVKAYVGPLSDDYCEACRKQVANHETDHGILCDDCYKQIYGEVA